MRNKFVLALIIAVILTSGCTSVRPPSGVAIAVRADPSPVFTMSPTNVFIDVDNRDTKTMENVLISVFDAGLLGGDKCEGRFERMLPYEFKTMMCTFYAPELRETTQTEINALASFDTTFSAVQLFDVMTQDEYQRRINSGDFRQASKQYSYSDKNVMVDIDFSEAPPVVLAPSKQYFVYFTVTNIGNGFIKKIDEGDLKVGSHGALYCPPFGPLEPNGKTFPRVACEVIVPESLMSGKEFISTQIIVDFRYTYELRNSVKIDIVK